MAILQKNLVKLLSEENIRITLYKSSDFGTELDSNVIETDADEIVVSSTTELFTFFTYKLPKKKEVTVEWILNKFAKSTDNTYIDFTNKFRKLLNKDVKEGINIYPTTYGIGVSILFGQPKGIDVIKERLDNANIEYKIEYSDAGWVYRFVISKSKSNLDKLKSF